MKRRDSSSGLRCCSPVQFPCFRTQVWLLAIHRPMTTRQVLVTRKVGTFKMPAFREDGACYPKGTFPVLRMVRRFYRHKEEEKQRKGTLGM